MSIEGKEKRGKGEGNERASGPSSFLGEGGQGQVATELEEGTTE